MSEPFRIDFIAHAGEVVMVFPEPYKFIHLSPATAREVAANITKLADEAEAQRAAKQ